MSYDFCKNLLPDYEDGLRLYFLNNFYFSGIHAGIQAGHCAFELAMAHPNNEKLKDFNENHKTFIILNGGMHGDLQKYVDLFSKQTQYPWSHFNESMYAANGALTSVGILVPEYVYRFKELMAAYKEACPSFMCMQQNLPLNFEFKLQYLDYSAGTGMGLRGIPRTLAITQFEIQLAEILSGKKLMS